MYPSFTGNARKPRNVNLSGRQPNPWARTSTTQNTAATSGSQHSVAHAQAERAERQKERDRQKASTIIQRTWRSHSSRTKTKNGWRREWDQFEIARTRAADGHMWAEEVVTSASGPLRYDSASQCFSQMRLLIHFVQIKLEMDRIRLAYYSRALKNTLEAVPDLATGDSWSAQLQRLSLLTADALFRTGTNEPTTIVFLDTIYFLTRLIPRRMARLSRKYFFVLGSVAQQLPSDGSHTLTQEAVARDVFSLLQPVGPETATAYNAFSLEILAKPHALLALGNIGHVVDGLNCRLLASSILRLSQESNVHKLILSETDDSSLWLLAHFLCIRSHAQKSDLVSPLAEDSDSVQLITALLGPKADQISKRLKVADGHVDLVNNSATPKPLPSFIRTQLSGLIERTSVESLLTSVPNSSAQSSTKPAFERASDLAAYALTLLRAFPSSADDIRRWLLQGTASVSGIRAFGQSAIITLWFTARATVVFQRISQSHRNAVEALRPPLSTVNFNQVPATGSKLELWNREWTVILLFFEIYTFVVKFTDDEDFVSGMESFSKSTADTSPSGVRSGALPLREIEGMVDFLKNLALPLYLRSSELVEDETEVDDAARLSAFFGSASVPIPDASKNGKTSRRRGEALAGSHGVTKDYLQGLVTGILRMIHEKDSRRKFLPADQWLMTNQLDMTNFISAVVQEEQNRHEIDDENEGDEEEIPDEGNFSERLAYARANALEQDKRQRKQVKEALRRRREQIAPWTEILRNLPFLIPFDTRVRIFREFIFQDQVRRRGGKDMVDAEMWRLSHMPGGSQARDAFGRTGIDRLKKHYAKIRRDSIFEDAYEQFYDLGDDLANPIQISFIDKFGEEEAGIDGGGVTKEFLNSVTAEAFDPSTEPRLFEENEQHLLYPSPTAMEERRELMRSAGFSDGTPEMREGLIELRKRYQFLGRIIGKCLYEGILVDTSFAGFFLIKWALTGGTTSASNESSYRASINDLLEFDESLYRGLLQLKNYSGNVEDFGLNFTIVDTIPLSYSPFTTTGEPTSSSSASHATGTTTITRDLVPSGSKKSVTNSNRLVYITAVVRHRLQQQPFDQTRAFISGLSQIIQPAWLAMFNQSELQTLVSGDRGAIDIDDLRAHTQYGGVYVIGDDGLEHPTIQLFWRVMKSLGNEDRAQVLKFVTSTPRAPLLGFRYLSPAFSIRDSGGGDQDRLPSTSTCVNLLKLPRYNDEEAMRKKLLYAVNSGAGFDLS